MINSLGHFESSLHGFTEKNQVYLLAKFQDLSISIAVPKLDSNTGARKVIWSIYLTIFTFLKGEP